MYNPPISKACAETIASTNKIERQTKERPAIETIQKEEKPDGVGFCSVFCPSQAQRGVCAEAMKYRQAQADSKWALLSNWDKLLAQEERESRRARQQTTKRLFDILHWPPAGSSELSCRATAPNPKQSDGREAAGKSARSL